MPQLSGTESRKEQILKTAANIFREKTYHGTTLRDIADSVGIREGSLYYHIESKENLLVDIILDSVEAWHDYLTRVENADLSPDERLKQIIRGHVKFNIDYREASTLYITEKNVISSLHILDKITAAFNRRDEIMARTIEDGIQSGLYRPVDVRVAVLAIVGLCNSILFWYRPDGRLSYQEIADKFYDLTHHALVAAAHPAK